MWEPFRRFRALEPGARGLFLRAALLLPSVSLSLRLRGFRATQQSLKNRIPRRAAKSSSVTLEQKTIQVALTARMLRSAAYRGLGNPSCLTRSLVLWFLLARQGIETNIRIGTRTSEGSFEAHAWVENGGIPVSENDDIHEHYAAFDESFSKLEQAKK